MVCQIHKNELREGEDTTPLQNNGFGPYESLPSNWKGLFFMFQYDLIKEEPCKIVDDCDDSNVK